MSQIPRCVTLLQRYKNTKVYVPNLNRVLRILDILWQSLCEGMDMMVIFETNPLRALGTSRWPFGLAGFGGNVWDLIYNSQSFLTGMGIVINSCIYWFLATLKASVQCCHFCWVCKCWCRKGILYRVTWLFLTCS